MTLDEAIEKLESMKRAYQELRDASIMNGIVSGNAGEIKGEWHSDDHVLEAYQKYIDALEMAIKALEKEPCEDTISRQAVLDYLRKMPSKVTSDGRRMVRRRTLEEYISDTL